MALSLAQIILPAPNDLPSPSLQRVTVHDKPYLIYPSDDAVLVLDERMKLVRTLPFSLAFPALEGRPGRVGALAVDESQGLIIASLASYVAVFSPGVSRDLSSSRAVAATTSSGPSWKVHSTMTSPREGVITSLAYHDGKLAITLDGSLSVWTSDMNNNMGLWELVWELRSPTLKLDWSSFSPSGEFISAYTLGEKSLRIFKLSKTGQRVGRKSSQILKFARPVSGCWWRNNPSDSTPILYTRTSTSIIHVHTPVLDDPSFFQLWSTLAPHVSDPPCSSVFPLDTSQLQLGIKAALGQSGIDPGRRKMLEDVGGGSKPTLGDAFVGIEQNGNGARVWSVVNMERKPPSLFKVLKLSHHTSGKGKAPYYPEPILDSSSNVLHSSIPSYTLLASPPPSQPATSLSRTAESPPASPTLLLISHAPQRPICPLVLSTSAFDPSASSTAFFSRLPGLKDPILGLSEPVDEFFRTPNGRSVLSRGAQGECIVWGLELAKKGTNEHDGIWTARARWEAEGGTELMALFARGRSVASYSAVERSISISYLRPTAPPSTLLQLSSSTVLPSLAPEHAPSILLALSDIDDGVSTATKLPKISFIIASTPSAFVYIWRLDAGDPTQRGLPAGEPTASLVSTFQLPNEEHGAEPAFVLPVDPMGWHQSVIDWRTKSPLQELLVVVSKDGVLSYWTPRLEMTTGVENTGGKEPWTRTGLVRTGKKDVVLARCSSRKKTALVVEVDGAHELSIWDSKSSEFHSGLEFSRTYRPNERILDLDWTTTADLQSVLAVGFRQNVVLLAEQRMSYVEGDGSYWAPFLQVDMASSTPNPIGDSVWLANGSLAVAAGNQLFIHSRFLAQEPEDDSPPRNVFEMVALDNSPLVDFNPQLLIQCMLWDKVELVKSIVTRLHLCIEAALNEGRDEIVWQRLDVSEFFDTANVRKKAPPKTHGALHAKYTSLFDDVPEIEISDPETFSRSLVDRLVEHLEGPFPLPLTNHERQHLITLVQTLVQIDEQSRALDLNGLRYLISLRFYVLWRQRSPASGSLTPASHESPRSLTHQHERISFRNVVWALHSESQEILLAEATSASSKGKMLWQDAKALGVFLWMRSAETLKSQLEVVARNEYMNGDDRDPSSCSLFYFALGKVKLVIGLWKQAAWHPEQKLMLKFLSNDFSQKRWKTAALKNAFALMSKQRFAYAAAFFLLGGSLKDAVNVCLRQLDDWQLAVALSRVVEGDNGPVLRSVLEGTVVPIAFRGGHRWLGTWAFWTLNRRDLAVRILVTPLKDLQASIDYPLPAVGDPHDDDPSLLLLFSQLRSKTMQTAKGTSEIREQTEFNFVLHNARVFTRMGCHVLALALLRSWTFQRHEPIPTVPTPPLTLPASVFSAIDDGDALDRAPTPVATPSTSPTTTIRAAPRPSPGGHPRRPSFLLTAGHRRQSSIIMDMDLPPTRQASPDLVKVAAPQTISEASKTPSPLPPTPVIDEAVQDEGTTVTPPPVSPATADKKAEEPTPARKTGLGTLMASAKDQRKQGELEFSFDAFGF